MNKVYFVSSQTATSVFQHELIKMTRLVRPCQVLLALTGISVDESEVAEREKCQVVRSVLKFRYHYSALLIVRLFNHGSSAKSRAEQSKTVTSCISNLYASTIKL